MDCLLRILSLHFRVACCALATLAAPPVAAGPARAADTRVAQGRCEEAAQLLESALTMPAGNVDGAGSVEFAGISVDEHVAVLAAQNRWAAICGHEEAHRARLIARSESTGRDAAPEAAWALVQLALGAPAAIAIDHCRKAQAMEQGGVPMEVTHGILVGCLLETGDLDAARANLAQLTAAHPESPWTALAQARVLFATEADPLPALQRIDSQWDEPIVPALTALAHLRAGEIVAARLASQQALFESPIHPWALRAAIDVAARSGQHDRVVEVATRARQWWPAEARFFQAHVRALLQLDRAFEEVAPWADDPQHGVAGLPELWCDVAWTYRDRQLLGRAVAALSAGKGRESIEYYRGLLAYLNDDTAALARARERVEDARHRAQLDKLWQVRSDADRRNRGRDRWGWYLVAVACAAGGIVMAYALHRRQRRRRSEGGT